MHRRKSAKILQKRTKMQIPTPAASATQKPAKIFHGRALEEKTTLQIQRFRRDHYAKFLMKLSFVRQNLFRLKNIFLLLSFDFFNFSFYSEKDLRQR